MLKVNSRWTSIYETKIEEASIREIEQNEYVVHIDMEAFTNYSPDESLIVQWFAHFKNHVNCCSDNRINDYERRECIKHFSALNSAMHTAKHGTEQYFYTDSPIEGLIQNTNLLEVPKTTKELANIYDKFAGKKNFYIVVNNIKASEVSSVCRKFNQRFPHVNIILKSVSHWNI